MTKVEAARLVAMLAAGYPSVQVSQETVELYVGLLLDLDFEPAQRAIVRLLTVSKFFPSMAEIREGAIAEMAGPKRTGIEAWGDVTRAVRYVGRYEQPTFEDPTVARAVDCMGWRNLCDSTNETADRARFAELYEDLQGRARSDMQAGRALPEPRRGYRITAGEQQEKLLTEKQRSARERLAEFEHPQADLTVPASRRLSDEELAQRLEMLREQARKLVQDEQKETP